MKALRVSASSPLLLSVLFLFTFNPHLKAQTWAQYGQPARFATAVLDPASKRMIVFGGQDRATGADLNDVWLVSISASKNVLLDDRLFSLTNANAQP
jgi:hypothetical protein